MSWKLAVVAALWSLTNPSGHAGADSFERPHPAAEAEARDVRALGQLFERFAASRTAHGGDSALSLRMARPQLLSEAPREAAGQVELDLLRGRWELHATGLAPFQRVELWWMENRPQGSVLPDDTDYQVLLHALRTDAHGSLEARGVLSGDWTRQRTPELLVLSDAGATPGTAPLLVARTSLLQRVYTGERLLGQFADPR